MPAAGVGYPRHRALEKNSDDSMRFLISGTLHSKGCGTFKKIEKK